MDGSISVRYRIGQQGLSPTFSSQSVYRHQIAQHAQGTLSPHLSKSTIFYNLYEILLGSDFEGDLADKKLVS